MAGNDKQRGAVRKTKKTPSKGTGGLGRKALEGKGPTPKAEERPYHRAFHQARINAKREAHEEGVAARQNAKAATRPQVSKTAELIIGRNPVVEAARAGMPFQRVFVADGVIKDARLGKVVQAAVAGGARLVECSRADLDRISQGQAHQGLVVEVGRYRYSDPYEIFQKAYNRWENRGDQPARPPLLVVLDKVTDPHNLGAVLRSAAAFGADAVVVPEHRSAPVNAVVWKVSAGAAAIVPVAQATNLTTCLRELKSRGAFIIGLDGGGQVDLPDLNLVDVPLVVVTGSEGAGISRLVRETCDQIVSIPILPRMESLNAAVATGIALYQVSVARAVNS